LGFYLDNKGEVVDKAHKQPTTHTRQTQASIIQNTKHSKVF
jgi:hypothetical protein